MLLTVNKTGILEIHSKVCLSNSLTKLTCCGSYFFGFLTVWSFCFDCFIAWFSLHIWNLESASLLNATCLTTVGRIKLREKKKMVICQIHIHFTSLPLFIVSSCFALPFLIIPSIISRGDALNNGSYEMFLLESCMKLNYIHLNL